MPVESHYFSRWYWYSIITYAYGHYFSGAINMCCDPGALDLPSHTCLLLAEACFKSVTSVFSRTNLVSLPSLTAQLKTRKFLFSFSNSMAHWPFHMVASDLADWTPAAIEGQSFLHCAFLEKYGVATENMPFFIVLLLVTRYAWDAVVIAVRAHGFFCVPKYKGRRWRDKLNLDVTLSRQSGQKKLK